MQPCPSCGGHDVRRSHSSGLFDALMSKFGKFPFRCRACTRRFYEYVEEEAGEVARRFPEATRRQRPREISPKRRTHETNG